MGEPIVIGMAGIGRAGWGMHCRELEGREGRVMWVVSAAREGTRF